MSAKTEQTRPDPIRPKCYIVGGGFDYIRLMFQLGCDGAKGLEDADFVLFTGGEDVTPSFYGEAPMAKTNYNRLRDDKELLIYQAALSRDLPMVGICRGGQALNVFNGGRMWQHVNNHCGPHIARTETATNPKTGKRKTITVTSTHHQMMIPTDDAIILLTANEATEKHSPALLMTGKKEPDVEVCVYPDTHCLCFQPHPEMKSATPECVDYFEECLDNWIYPHIPNDTHRAIIAPMQVKEK